MGECRWYTIPQTLKRCAWLLTSMYLPASGEAWVFPVVIAIYKQCYWKKVCKIRLLYVTRISKYLCEMLVKACKLGSFQSAYLEKYTDEIISIKIFWAKYE